MSLSTLTFYTGFIFLQIHLLHKVCCLFVFSNCPLAFQFLNSLTPSLKSLHLRSLQNKVHGSGSQMHRLFFALWLNYPAHIFKEGGKIKNIFERGNIWQDKSSCLCPPTKCRRSEFMILPTALQLRIFKSLLLSSLNSSFRLWSSWENSNCAKYIYLPTPTSNWNKTIGKFLLN